MSSYLGHDQPERRPREASPNCGRHRCQAEYVDWDDVGDTFGVRGEERQRRRIACDLHQGWLSDRACCCSVALALE